MLGLREFDEHSRREPGSCRVLLISPSRKARLALSIDCSKLGEIAPYPDLFVHQNHKVA
jgi:hypothetical protein